MREMFVDPASEVVRQFLAGLSMLVAALVILLAGWIVAKIIRILVTRLFKAIQVDKLVDESGLKQFLEKGNVQRSISELLGMGIYWLIMLVVLFLALRSAGVEIPPTAIDALMTFIPKFILGLLIFIFSLFVANLFAGIVRTSAANSGIARADVLGKVTQTAIVVFGIVVALQEIGIAAAFLGNVFIIVLASFCFGFALAFALGAKDLVKSRLEEWFGKKPVQ